MNKRALALLTVTALLVVGLAWSIQEVRQLRAEVAAHGSRISALEVSR